MPFSSKTFLTPVVEKGVFTGHKNCYYQKHILISQADAVNKENFFVNISRMKTVVLNTYWT